MSIQSSCQSQVAIAIIEYSKLRENMDWAQNGWRGLDDAIVFPPHLDVISENCHIVNLIVGTFLFRQKKEGKKT